jgi:hypothetical protein
MKQTDHQLPSFQKIEEWFKNNYEGIDCEKTEFCRDDIENAYESGWSDRADQEKTISENEKDAVRYQWLSKRFTGYDFHWSPDPESQDEGKCVAVFNVGEEFRGSFDISKSIDDALDKGERGKNEIGKL